MTTKNKDRGKRRASNVLTFFNILFLAAAVMIITKVIYIQYIWEPDPAFVSYFQPKKVKQEIEPERGSIIDHNGKLLAMSTPLYDIYMDCRMLKDEFQSDKNAERGAKNEKEWQDSARALAKKLPGVLKSEKHNAGFYENLILSSREKTKGGRYVPIVKNIDHETMLELKKLPLYNEKISYRNSMIVEKKDTRQYPYGELAKRVIGYVRNNSDTTTRHVGIEGKFNHYLHGEKGHEWKKITDKNVMIRDVDSNVVDVKNGLDVRTTLDINIQDIADRALRRNMAKDSNIIGGCVVILDVETGAVRAMANLTTNKKGELGEFSNVAVGRPAEPGSVFKAVSLTTLLEDGCLELETRIPTNQGKFTDLPKISQDRYIVNYENKTHNKTISVVEGFEISSNYVFRKLVYDNYKDKPKEFINRLHEYNFGETYQFDLSGDEGNARPSLPDPDSRSWTMSDLVSVAIGYSARVTPLQVATFYNAIANNGKMMKPYIVESLESNNKVVKQYKPTLLNGSICSKATADTLTRALKMVTLEGTASKLKNAKCTVAGKTGTSRMYLKEEERPGSRNPYETLKGEKKHQATFVGFFPADEPQYTAIVVVYTGLMKSNVYGGNIPVLTFKDIADELWAYDDEWGEELKARGEVPRMKARNISTSKSSGSPVPDVKGLGLKDAYYAIENNGYRCRHSGTGHVISQVPAAGDTLEKGMTINITLE